MCSPRVEVVGDPSHLRRGQPRRVREQQPVLHTGYRGVDRDFVYQVRSNRRAKRGGLTRAPPQTKGRQVQGSRRE